MRSGARRGGFWPGGLAVLAALLVLTAASWGAAQVPLGPLAVPAALGIAAVKVALVGAYFMELVRAPASFRLVVVSALSLLALLVTLVALDVVTR